MHRRICSRPLAPSAFILLLLFACQSSQSPSPVVDASQATVHAEDGWLCGGTGLTVYYRDADQDGYGNPAFPLRACHPPRGFVDNYGDCDDADAAVLPGATEVCNGIDDDCNTLVDVGDPALIGDFTYFRDADGDGYGDDETSIQACDSSPPAGYVTDDTDCNDCLADIYPGAPEVPDNGLDDDCDGVVDEGFVAVSGGYFHSVAARGDGTAWAWGSNDFGQLGNGTNISSNVPVQVSGLTDVVDVAAGWDHNLALLGDGTVWAWGVSRYGELGNGTTGVASNVPVQVSGLTHVIDIAAGESISFALKDDGTVWAWGLGRLGAMGNGTTSDSAVPVQVSSLACVNDIAAGAGHGLAVTGDGAVWTWGFGEYGQLGNGTFSSSNVPVQVTGLNGATAVAGGVIHSLALMSDGTISGWGYNLYGGLGDGTNSTTSVPVLVLDFDGAVAIDGNATGSIALRCDGTVWTWGRNDLGQLGNGSGSDSNVPILVSSISGVIGVAGGWGHNLVLEGDGTAWGWGYNQYGQLGTGDNLNHDLPVPVAGF